MTLRPRPGSNYSLCHSCKSEWQANKQGLCLSCRKKPCLICGTDCVSLSGFCKDCHAKRPRTFDGIKSLVDKAPPELKNRYLLKVA